MDWSAVLISLSGVLSAVLVAVFNNWEKINPSKRYVRESREMIEKLKTVIDRTEKDVKELSSQTAKISSAQRTTLQTIILEDCKKIQDAVADGGEYEEALRQLIILYKEYHACGFNSQGKLYFNETLEVVSKDKNAMVRNLMNQYFPDYDPAK